ncbi:MAG: hypothetical protein ACRDRK_03350 [Pseudonocardia sp.]
MRPSHRIAVLLGCVLLALGVARYAGSRSAPPAPQPAAGSVRLGPEAGEPVAQYLAGLPALLPAPGTATLALVQFRAEMAPAAALATVGGDGTAQVGAAQVGAGRGDASARSPVPVTAVLRVPLPRVQTALRFEALEPGVSPTTALDTARERARRAADAGAARLTGRQAALAAAEAAVLADPACRCVLAVVVRADRAGLEAIAARAGARAVHAAPAGAVPIELVLAPLLPEQVERADPPPDDGPVPRG